MTSRRLKKSVLYGAYILGLIMLIGIIYLLEAMMPKKNFSEQEYSYVSKTIFDDVIPVIKVEEKLSKPFNAADVNIVKKYYVKNSDEKEQQEAIINLDNTYMQSNGIVYGKESLFDVLSILPGVVTDVREDNILGNIVEIKHNDNVTSIYSCLSKTAIQKGDNVIAGQVIGQSGSNNIVKDTNNIVHFELIVNGKTVNPLEYYGKTLNEIKG